VRSGAGLTPAEFENTKDFMAVGARLREARQSMGLSARELCRRAGRPETQCALIEARNQRVVRPDILADFARVLRCTVAWLSVGEGPGPEVVPAGTAGGLAAAPNRLGCD
jgi:transcriptional regulator with XRE-family HTH domain